MNLTDYPASTLENCDWIQNQGAKRGRALHIRGIGLAQKQYLRETSVQPRLVTPAKSGV
jgi:hypothetical protein